MPVQINELVIRAEITNEHQPRQNISSTDEAAKIQKIIDELVKISKNKNER